MADYKLSKRANAAERTGFTRLKKATGSAPADFFIFGGLATKADFWGLATWADFWGLATWADFWGLATRADFWGLAT